MRSFIALTIAALFAITEVQSHALHFEKSHRRLAPVNVTTFSESLCPGCNLFIRDLHNVYALLGDEYVTLEEVEYGNAREKFEDGHWKFTCQHGEPECLGNFIEACVVDHFPKTADWLAFVYCFSEKYIPGGRHVTYRDFDVKTASQECAQAGGLDWESLWACAQGAQGEALVHANALRTDALKPAHQYVPWIVVNGEHTDEIQQKAQDDLLGLICSYFPAGQKPPKCPSTDRDD